MFGMKVTKTVNRTRLGLICSATGVASKPKSAGKMAPATTVVAKTATAAK
jgi:hypothetical protein